MKYNIMRLAERLDLRPGLAATLIFAVALCLRVPVALHLPAQVLWSDGHRYMHIADNLLSHDTFGSLEDNRFSAPVQPLLIAAARLMFGTNITALRLFFVAIGAATCVVGYALTRRLFGPLAALLAGIGLAVYPHFLYLSALFEYPQTFFILAVGASFLALFEYLRTGRMALLGACGLLLGLAILTVPTIEVFVPLLLACMLVRRPRPRPSALIVLSIAVALPVGAWATRNYVQYGELILVNRGGGIAFWTGNNPTYYEFGKQAVVPLCGKENEDFDFCKEFRAMRRVLHGVELPEAEKVSREDREEMENGMRFVRASPQRAAILTVRKFVQFWSPIPDAVTNSDSSRAAMTWVSILSYVPVLLLGFAGMLLSWRRWRALLPIYAYFAALTAVYSVFLPTTRYRLPLDFFLIIFTAWTLTRLVPAWRQSQPAPGTAAGP